MALAFLRFRGQENGYYLFQADVGTAKYFKYVLGEKVVKLKLIKNEYVKVLSGDKKVSKLYQVNEALRKIGQGSFPLKIPQSEVADALEYIQLYSFVSKDPRAPTVSNIVRLYPFVSRKSETKNALGLSLETPHNIINQSVMQDFGVKNKAFNYSEPPYSKVMFWNTIVKALPGLIKHAAPILGGLLGGGKKKSASPNTATNNQTSDIINKVVEVLAAIANKKSEAAIPAANPSGTAAAGTSNSATAPTNAKAAAQSMGTFSSAYTIEPQTLIGLGPILEKILSPEAILAIGDQPQKLFLAVGDAVQKTENSRISNHSKLSDKPKSKAKTMPFATHLTKAKKTGYSEAQIAPALLAALPALMPVIEKALDPKLIEAIGNQPVKLFKAIGDTVLKMDEQEFKHLEAINPGVDSADDIAKLLQGMSLGSALHKNEAIPFKMIKNLNLDFVKAKTVSFKGKDRILYSKNQRILIPFKIMTDAGSTLNKTLDKSIVQIIIKDADTLKLVFRKNMKLLDVNISQTISDAYLTPDEIKQIPCNTELKLEVSYIWKNGKNQKIGVFKSHYVHFIDTYIFDRIGERIGTPIPLNDINQHRKFWHKVWEGGFSESDRWHVEFDLKYFYLLNKEVSELSRLETRKMITADNMETGQEQPKRRKVHAKIKGGTEFGLDVLNSALSLLNQEPLDDVLLNVLRRSDINKEFHQVARQRLEMKGREGDTATLWSYPEITLHKLYLSQAVNVDTYGQVTDLTTLEKVIPKPDLIHFIGTKSDR